MSRKSISLFSTFATDTLLNEQREVISVQAGGPALFLRDALLDAGVSFHLATNETVEVEILVTDTGEFGRISQKPIEHIIDVKKSSWTVVSTLLDEWQIPFEEIFDTNIIVDAQGFVRDVNNFKVKKLWRDADKISGKIFCVKATKEEARYLPTTFLEAQKQRLLVITDGEKGIEIFYKGERILLPVPVRVRNLPDTIGAGDTFLGYFTAALQLGDAPREAGAYAIAKTTRFLKRKKNVRHEAV